MFIPCLGSDNSFVINGILNTRMIDNKMHSISIKVAGVFCEIKIFSSK